MFADQKLEALALLYFERKQGGNLKLQTEPPMRREGNMIMDDEAETHPAPSEEKVITKMVK